MPEYWSDPGVPWPLDPTTVGGSATRHGRPSRRCRGHVEDGRHAADLDGNEELERLAREAEAPSSRPSRAGDVGSLHHFTERDAGDTDEWVASRLFTHEDELEDTWPNLPPPDLRDG
jgi:hypothetical protein